MMVLSIGSANNVRLGGAMSVRLLMAITDTTNQFKSSSEKLLLLVLGGLANDEGECFALVKTLAKKCACSERSVRRSLQSLEEAGFIRRGFRKAQDSEMNISSKFFLDIEKIYLSTMATNKNKLFPEFTRKNNSLDSERSCKNNSEGGTDKLSWGTDKMTVGTDNMADITSTLTNSNNINIISNTRTELENKECMRNKASKRKAKISAKNLNYSSWPSLPNEQVLNDWLEHRKLKRASVTQTVVNLLGKQLHDCVESGISVDMALEASILRGWTGLQAEWVISHYSKGATVSTNNKIASNISNAVIEMNDTAWAEGLEQRLLDKGERTYGS